MINSWNGTGRLTKQPQLKYTSTNNVPVLNFTLAVNRRFESQDGTDADFINCVSFRKTAEAMANYLHKGSLIGIEGRLQTRTYQDNDGKTVFVTEVVVDNFSFLESKNQASNSNQGYGQANTQPNYKNSTQSNFSGNNSNLGNFDPNNDPFENNEDVTDIDPDDLPF